MLPPGRYLSGTLHLRSHISVWLEAGAVLIGTTNLERYAQPTVPAFMPEARWGKWHRALILGENLEDVTIAGAGVVDGNKVFDPTGEERMRGPHTIVFVGCRRFSIRDISIVHRLGHMDVGECSIVIAVASAHRGPAFDACRFAIDTIKQIVPI